MQYAEILVDVRGVRRVFHYAIPPRLLADVARGSFVRIPFRKKEVDGIVIDLTKTLPAGLTRDNIRSLTRVIRKEGIVPPALLSLAGWMADHYLCSPADALFAILPPFPQRVQLNMSPQQSSIRKQGKHYFVYGRMSARWKRYEQAIMHAVRRGQRVIICLPSRELAGVFADFIQSRLDLAPTVYSAELPRAKRFRVWERIAAGQPDVVVGTRPAVLLPLPAVGLIIVDDEANFAHKEDQHPKYHTGDVAIARANIEGAHVLLGGLLPSVRLFQDIASGKARVIRDHKPVVSSTLVDTSGTTDPLPHLVQEAMQRTRKAIIFTTRLGVGTATRCMMCRHEFRCHNCHLPLTMHRPSTLRCHHCGHSEDAPGNCPVCGSTRIRPTGVGAERLVEIIAGRFPRAQVKQFAAGDTIPADWDFLVTSVKLLDTDLSAPVVVASGLDTILDLPDPFAVERAARLAVELRARATKAFFVKTAVPDHRVFQVLQDPEGYLAEEVLLRARAGYPPATQIVRIIDRGDLAQVRRRLMEVAETIKRTLSPNEAIVLGPGPTFYEYLRGSHRWHVLVKLLSPNQKVRAKLKTVLPRSFLIDSDPIDLL